MNDIIITSIVWIGIGALWTYYSDKRAYNEGMLEAIQMHNEGRLTYKSYFEGDTEMLDIVVKPYEE